MGSCISCPETVPENKCLAYNIVGTQYKLNTGGFDHMETTDAGYRCDAGIPRILVGSHMKNKPITFTQCTPQISSAS